MSRDRATRWLSWFVGVTFIVLGLVEVAVRVLSDDPVDPTALLWWCTALCGGGALVLLGSFKIRSPGWALASILVGATLGIVATAWTVVLPVVVLAMVGLQILGPRTPTATGA